MIVVERKVEREYDCSEEKSQCSSPVWSNSRKGNIFGPGGMKTDVSVCVSDGEAHRQSKVPE